TPAAAAFVFEPEARAQQAAGIVGHAPQPGFGRRAALAFGRAFIGWRLVVGRLRSLLFAAVRARRVLQRLLDALALRGVGLLLAFAIVLRRLRFRRRCLFLAGGVGLRRRRGRRAALLSRRAVRLFRRRLPAAGGVVAGLLVARVGLLARRARTLRGLPLQRRLDHGAVGDRVFHPRLPAQRLVVGLDRVFQAPDARQRIASVVGGVGAGQVVPDALGLVVAAGAIRVQAFAHAQVFDLVGSSPGRALRRFGGVQLRRQQQAGTQRHERHPAAERQQHQQHQRQQQPVAVVAPDLAAGKRARALAAARKACGR